MNTHSKPVRILSIETSCDETALSIVSVDGSDPSRPRFEVICDALHSQVDVHREYGGVFPALAKREHAANLAPLLDSICDRLPDGELAEIDPLVWDKAEAILEREPVLFGMLRALLPVLKKPDIDLIAVTKGPGLEPALWVGINAARVLSLIWNVPMVGADHMEGHVASALGRPDVTVTFPAIALLVSGGHTELVLVRAWGDYDVIGSTRDDAVGEAFDKAARILGLQYPGGPEISKRAVLAASDAGKKHDIILPRPMINSGDLDFSFSGLKTAVLYAVRDFRAARGLAAEAPLPDDFVNECCKAFEEAAVDVLVSKAKAALSMHGAQTLLVGGGVIANTSLRKALEALAATTGTNLALPDQALSTDNSIMIAVAGYLASLREEPSICPDIAANGTLTL
jgi:N6-L-threonylcarbamoyladenine synthase